MVGTIHQRGSFENVFRERSKDLIRKRKEKEKYLFEEMGYSYSYGYKVMSGNSKLTIDFMIAMADLLECSLDYLCGRINFVDPEELVIYLDEDCQLIDETEKFETILHENIMYEQKGYTKGERMFTRELSEIIIHTLRDSNIKL